LDFEGGADNLRNDAATQRVYVGFGDDEKNGAIAAVDAMTNQRLDEEYKIWCRTRVLPARKRRSQYLCEHSGLATDRSN
jgi:hypothetical protein